MSRRILCASMALLCIATHASGQSPSVLYTWDHSGNVSPEIESWIRSFGAVGTSATLDNATFGVLTLTETGATAGGSQAFSDGFNRVRESSVASSGAVDLTGLDFLQFDLSHTGVGSVDVAFYVQASPASTFVQLGPDVAVSPGLNTYQVPLSGLTAEQIVYVRTVGLNIRDHAAQGNLTWSVHEVRSGGTPLTERVLASFDNGTAEGGLQGMIVNFDNAAVQGNNGGQNQTGLSHNSAGSGSVQWTDLGGQNGAAVSIGNGTAWSGNTFNMRTTDLSNYDTMIVRMSATDPREGGGVLGVGAFFQVNNFVFQSVEGGVGKDLPIDGEFHELIFSLAGLTNMNVVDLTGINLFSHPQDLIINIDSIRFTMAGPVVPEPASVLSLAAVFGLAALRRARRGA